MSKISICSTSDRKDGVKAAVNALGFNPVKGKNVLIKPNFNTADIAPGSTHIDILSSLIDVLWSMGAKSLALGERSYPPTREVMEAKNVFPLLAEKDVKVIDFDDLSEKDWVECNPQGSHWKNGFRVARPILESECLVYACCLKTHQFGGVITMALKLSVGVVPTFRNGFNYMNELHSSRYQQEMIAEINVPFSPSLVVMDGVDAFVDGGPATGKSVKANVVTASACRVTNDAVGVALLKHLGSNADIMSTPVFAQKQIKRAAELNLGPGSANNIELTPADAKSSGIVDAVRNILNNDG